MGGFQNIAASIGGVGNDVAGAKDILAKQRRAQLEDQLRKWQMQMDWLTLQSRLQEQASKTPEGQLKALNTLLGHDAAPEERQRYAGVAPPLPKAKYLDLKADATGKMWGLNAETNRYELVPGSEAFMAPKKTGTGSVDPIIAAQIGKPPDPAAFPRGENDSAYQAQRALWGTQAETIKTRMARAIAEARGNAYQMSKGGSFLTPDGEIVATTWGNAIRNGLVPYAPGFQSMSKQAQFTEMRSASSRLRSAIESLRPEDAFNAPQVAQMNRAMDAPDEGTVRAIIANLMASGLNDRQQDYVIWLSQMAERVLSLRSVAGMGQGAQDIRSAIQATLPNIASGNKEFALKRLDAVDNQINMLYTGVPKTKIKGAATTQAAPLPAGATLDNP